MRTTIDISDDAYQIAKTVAREQGKSLGRVVSEFIIGTFERPEALQLVEEGTFPTFRCQRRVTSEDVKSLEDE